MTMKRTFKTVKKLSGQNLYRKWEQWDVGDVLIGKLVGFKVDQYKKNCPLVQVIDAQFKDDSGDDFNGKTLLLNSCGILDKAIAEVEEGQMIQLEYNGQSMIEKGPYKGKEAHNMSIEVVEYDDSEDEASDDVL